MKRAVIIQGKPGSGKGTQANLLSWSKGFFHFDTGKEVEWLLHDPHQQNDPIIQRERALFDGGILMTPEWVLKFVTEKVQEIAKAGLSVVFSGSPRTLFEAFGDKNTEGLVQTLEKSYGRENMFFIFIDVHSDASIFRNTNRKICSVCKIPVLANHPGDKCPICAGELYKRVLDTPEIIKVRLEEFENRTKPIITELKKYNHTVHTVHGESMPFEVHQKVLKILGYKVNDQKA